MAIIFFWYTILIVFILGRLIYMPNRGKKEFLFTFLLLAAIIFLICLLVRRVEIGLAFAIGIFAIFGIIRYRTTPIMPREMTYIFLCAGIAAKNGLVSDEVEFYKLLTSDLFLLLLAGSLEYILFRKKISTKTIVYNNLALITPENRGKLTRDLEAKYGLTHIQKIKIGKIDELKNMAQLLVILQDDEDNHFED